MIKLRSGTWMAVLPLATFLWASPSRVTGEEQAPTAGQSVKKTNPFSDLSLTSGQGPINIRSHKLEFFYNEKRVVYRGEIVATRGDGTLKSDELTVTYEDSPAAKAAVQPAAQTDSTSGIPGGQRIKEAVAEGNVEITSTDRRATCKKAVFNEIARTVVLSGDVVLRQSDNEVRGQTVTVYLDEGRTVVERGSESEVSMKINQTKQEKNKKESENGKKGGQTP